MRKPWEDEKGMPLDDEALRVRSASWSPQIWQAYLQTIEVPQSEVLVQNFDRMLRNIDKKRPIDLGDVDESAAEAYLHVSPKALRKALLKLTFRQRNLVELVYLQGHTITSAAGKIGISREAASGTLTRALLRTRKILAHRLNTHRDGNSS